MIKRYKQFNEGISKYLKGPTFDEMIKSIGVNNFFKKMLISNNEDGIKYALEKNASIEVMNDYKKLIKWFNDILENLERYIEKSEFSMKIEDDIIYYIKNDDLLFDTVKSDEDESLTFVGVNYDKIWKKIKNNYGYSDNEVKKFISTKFEDFFGFEHCAAIEDWDFDLNELKQDSKLTKI